MIKSKRKNSKLLSCPQCVYGVLVNTFENQCKCSVCLVSYYVLSDGANAPEYTPLHKMSLEGAINSFIRSNKELVKVWAQVLYEMYLCIPKIRN